MAGDSWSTVDRLNRPYNLGDSDFCFYYLRYTPYAGYEHSYANQEVINYKIPIGGANGLTNKPSRAPHKQRAIENYASAIIEFMSSKTLRNTGERLVDLGGRVGIAPAPTSMTPDDPEFDDRNVRTCDIVCDRTGFRFCRDVETMEFIGQSHSQGMRSPELIRGSLGRVAHGCDGCEFVFVVDDVLTTGAHFVAIKFLLQESGCSAQVFGIFYAKSEL